MPYIALTTPQTLSAEQKQTIAKDLGSIISALPGKSEGALMIDFCDGHTMYFRGNERKDCAFVDVRIYGSIGFSFKSEFTLKLFEVMNKNLGLTGDDVFMNFSEHATWGSAGIFK